MLFIEADGIVVWDRAGGVDHIDTSHAGRVRDPRVLPAPFFTPRTPHAWDPADGWRPSAAASRTAAAPRPGRLRVLTWNTLWDRYDSARIHTAKRRPLLLAALAGSDADVIALQEVESALLALGEEAVVHMVGSRRMGCALPKADLDLVAVLPGPAVDMADVQGRLTTTSPDAARVRRVTGARVPGLRFAAAGLDVDLVVVAVGSLAPAEAVARRAELGEAAAIALSAVSDAAAVLATTRDDHAGFAALAGKVKAWAKARGLDAAPFGGLPGLAWTVLAACTAREAGGLPADDVLRHFFATWAAWDWREPIALAGTPAEAGSPITVMTPTEPFRNCAEQVGPEGRDLLTQEFYRAWEILETAAETGGDPWPEFLSPPPLHRRHAAWAVLTVRPRRPGEFEEALGRVRGRVRALLTALADAGVTDAQAWPRPFVTGPATAKYAIGLGQAPPDRARLAEIAAGWGRGLPAVRIDWMECGAVPSLR